MKEGKNAHIRKEQGRKKKKKKIEKRKQKN
jgi:hypothetical protein